MPSLPPLPVLANAQVSQRVSDRFDRLCLGHCRQELFHRLMHKFTMSSMESQRSVMRSLAGYGLPIVPSLLSWTQNTTLSMSDLAVISQAFLPVVSTLRCSRYWVNDSRSTDLVHSRLRESLLAMEGHPLDVVAIAELMLKTYQFARSISKLCCAGGGENPERACVSVCVSVRDLVTGLFSSYSIPQPET